MSAHFEQFDRLRLRRRFACILLAAIAFSTVPNARSQCPPPIIHPPACSGDGRVELRWVHPDYFSDTIPIHMGGYAHPFRVSKTCSECRIAIKLPPCPATALLHAIRAYFIGDEGVNSETWSVRAAFAWSLHADSQGVPGAALYPEQTWLIGENPSLRSGGWYQDVLDWWIPDTLNARLWLVGQWPELARQVVELGADNQTRPSEIELMAGYSDASGAQWIAITEPGLLIDIGLLHTQPVANETISPGESLLVLRDLVSGPLSPSLDTVWLTNGGPFVWYDSLPIAGQVLRYGVSMPCSSDVNPSWASDFRVPVIKSLDLSPESLLTQLHPGSDSVLSILFKNQETDSLLITLDPIQLAMDEVRFSMALASSINLFPDPDSMLLAPGESLSTSLTVPLSDLTTDTYSSWLIAQVRKTDGTLIERRAAFIRFGFDLTTSVEDRSFEDHGGGDSPPRSRYPELFLTSTHGTFEDRIELQLQVHRRPSVRSARTIADVPASAEITVCNVLGRKVKHQVIPVRFQTDGETSKTILVIDGTSRWSSGVYLVRVRCAGNDAALKLLHLK